MANTIDIFNSKIDESKLVGDNKFFNKSEELTEFNKLQQKYISNVDYSNPSNFARFGSAEEYYKNAINYINSEYPYDACTTDKLKWVNSLNEFEYYIYSKEFPRSTGYLTLQSDQYIAINSPYKLENQSTKDAFNNKLKIFNNIIDFDDGITYEAWIKLSDTYQNNFLNINYISGSDGNLEKNKLFQIFFDGATALSVVLDEFYYTFYINLEKYYNNWHHYSVYVKNQYIALYIDGNYIATTATGVDFPVISTSKFYLTTIGLVEEETYKQVTNIGSFTDNTVFEIGGNIQPIDNYGYQSNLNIDEVRLWNGKRSIEDIGRYWFTNIDGNDSTDAFNNNLLFYYKFNEGWDDQYGLLCLDYSGHQNDAEIINYNTSCRTTGSAFDLSGIVQDKERGDIVLKGISFSTKVQEYYNNKISSGKEYDYFNIHSLYNKFPSWVLQQEEEQNIKHLKQIIQIVSSYFDDLYNKIKESSDYKTIKNNTDKDNLYPFYDKILTSTGFDVTDLFSNLDTIEKISSRNDTTLFDEDIEKIKNAIFQNIYNNLSYILKSKGTEKSIKSFLRSYGVNEQLVRINLYADGAEYNSVDRSKQTVVRKKVIHLVNDNIIYQPYDVLGFLESGSLNYYTLETCLKPVQSNLLTCSLFGLTCNPDGNTTNIYGSNYSYHIAIENDPINGSRFILQNSSSTVASSSYYQNLYDGSVWNLALRKKPTVDTVNGAENIQYNIELYGVNTNSAFQKSFEFNIPLEGDTGYIKYYIGARKEHLDSSTSINETDSEFLYCNFWGDYLNNETITAHNKELLSYGVDE